MAGDWIKMRKTLPTDPRIVRIMSALKADRFRTLGGVLSAWCLFDDQTEDGQLDGYSPEVFDEVIGFPGLARAMAAVGWLEIGPDYLKAPRFSEHNGQSAKRRAQENVRKMSARDADKKRTESALEKRREEKSIKEVSKDTSSDERCSPPSDDSGFVFALQGGVWHLPEKKLAEYTSTYKFDVRQELLKASQWLRDNKPRRPRTGSGMKKFLTSWMNRVDSRTPVNAKLSGRIPIDDSLKAELARAKAIREARSNGQISGVS
jgi:hypothetical protein